MVARRAADRISMRARWRKYLDYGRRWNVEPKADIGRTSTLVVARWHAVGGGDRESGVLFGIDHRRQSSLDCRRQERFSTCAREGKRVSAELVPAWQPHRVLDAGRRPDTHPNRGNSERGSL